MSVKQDIFAHLEIINLKDVGSGHRSGCEFVTGLLVHVKLNKKGERRYRVHHRKAWLSAEKMTDYLAGF